MGTKASKTFGEFIKERRIALGKTLREFCSENGIDPGNYSKLERGLLSPPQARDKLEEYAKNLKLRKGSAEWFEFFDLAAVAAGRIPQDLRDDEILRRLPVLFRTIRGKKLPEKELDWLIERLKDKE